MYKLTFIWCSLALCFFSCLNNDSIPIIETDWVRDQQNPVYRDAYSDGSYESASDAHIFYDEEGTLQMIYSGDTDFNSSIKLAQGTSFTNWNFEKSLLFEANDAGSDIHKETAFYRKTSAGKHQIYYIGYPNEAEYKAQIFLAEADDLHGPYTQKAEPIVPVGDMAGKSVYCITSPSIMEYNDQLYIAFLAWNDSPANVSEVWVIGAVSTDEGHSWSNFEIVETPIGMEGQVTQKNDSTFVAVRTGEYKGAEAIFYSTSAHPFGPWETSDTPILVKTGVDLEKDEIIAPQITFDKESGEEFLFYTGADYQKGWWMMLARKE